MVGRELTVGAFCPSKTIGHVLVVGDLMLDCYVSGSAGRVSQEVPVFLLRHRQERENAGGVGNVACNLVGLGLSVRVVGAIGQDPNADRLLQELKVWTSVCK